MTLPWQLTGRGRWDKGALYSGAKLLRTCRDKDNCLRRTLRSIQATWKLQRKAQSIRYLQESWHLLSADCPSTGKGKGISPTRVSFSGFVLRRTHHMSEIRCRCSWLPEVTPPRGCGSDCTSATREGSDTPVSKLHRRGRLTTHLPGNLFTKQEDKVIYQKLNKRVTR